MDASGGGPPHRGPGRDGAALWLIRDDPHQWSEGPRLPRRLRHERERLYVSCAPWAVIAGVFSRSPRWRRRPPQRDRTAASIGMALLVH
jgi:hypothetical protein